MSNYNYYELFASAATLFRMTDTVLEQQCTTYIKLPYLSYLKVNR